MSNPISVVGGSYFEECNYPRKCLSRGSGGRAASLLSSWLKDVTFHTYLGPDLKPIFDDFATSFQFKLQAYSKESDICFRYRYPLSIPSIHGSYNCPIEDINPIRTENTLVFGMLEQRPVVHSRTVVYDPQNGSNAEVFDSNGSTADKIAYVVSYSEGVALTAKRDPENIADELLSLQNVEVVIVKCGPAGALVVSCAEKGWVKAMPTQSVFKVGTGDIFSTAFAMCWIVLQKSPLLAAWFASFTVAEYVNSATDRIPASLIETLLSDAERKLEEHGHSKKSELPEETIYLAGPFFNTAEQWIIDEVRESLIDMGFNVFSPIHDVGEGDIDYVATSDLLGLENSSAVLAILNGIDCGTVFEIGYARALSIPVIVVAESVDERHLTMILGSGCSVTTDLTTGIYKVCWELMENQSE
ncbi:hypothetical protein BZG05_01590 [Salinivibrio kushneri]|uniref:nucleoside 2-deoxyribosyltransferase n=1 Tax=Salinivibrio kushneri TaxID=1908198 RepID=UPI000989861F|nr:nucleoside 2-deoxyribosyltransferase [Salinivibrio kushneri]OOE36202.1 hypothetical protein BZG05_01590 [Salinivibrio kushneri]